MSDSIVDDTKDSITHLVINSLAESGTFIKIRKYKRFFIIIM